MSTLRSGAAHELLQIFFGWRLRKNWKNTQKSPVFVPSFSNEHRFHDLFLDHLQLVKVDVVDRW